MQLPANYRSLLVDAALLTTLSYISALVLEQIKPGFFSNTMDISLLLVLAIILISLVLILRPVYRASYRARLYYGLWCLALAGLFVKLVRQWLDSTIWLALGVVVCVIGLLALVSYHNNKE